MNPVIRMTNTPTNRGPTHPGEMLMEEFLKPMQITQREFADAIHVPYQRVNELANKNAELHQVLH